MTGRRDVRIDAVRGLCLLVMAGRHMDFPIRPYCWRTLGFAGVAQLFVFMSGLVLAIVQTRALAGPGDPDVLRRELRRRSVRRAALLWAVHVALLVYLALVVHVAQGAGRTWVPRTGRLVLEDPLAAIASGAVFLWQPPLHDILPMYCLFLLAAPFVLPRLADRGPGERAVLAGSGLLWLAAQFGLLRTVMEPFADRFPVVVTAFDPFAWQLLFVAGMWFGVRTHQGRPLPLPRAAWPGVVMLTVHVVQTLVARRLDDRSRPDDAWSGIWRRESLGPVSLIAFANVAYLGAWLATVRPKWFSVAPLALLGRHALLLFVVHLVLVVPTWTLPPDLPLAVQWGLTFAIFGVLFVVAWAADRRMRRRRAARVSAGNATAPG